MISIKDNENLYVQSKKVRLAIVKYNELEEYLELALKDVRNVRDSLEQYKHVLEAEKVEVEKPCT